MNEALKKKTAQAALDRAMKLWQEESYVEQPVEAVKFDRYRDELTREQLDQGVKLLVAHCRLGGGSVGNVDLYKLVRTYLWDEDARAAINRLMDSSRN